MYILSFLSIYYYYCNKYPTIIKHIEQSKKNTLQLNDRNRHTNKEINCMVCDKDEKHCTAYKQDRSHSTHLQQPYIESDEDILGLFLFDKEDIEERKNCYLPYGKEDNIK